MAEEERLCPILTVASIKLLDIRAATQITANGINDHGQVVGQFVDKNGVVHGFVWEASSFLRWITQACRL